MLNVYENRIPPNGKDNQQLYGAQDFISRLSAFDDAFSHTLGITVRRQPLTTQDSKTNRNKFSLERIPTVKVYSLYNEINAFGHALSCIFLG